MNLSSNSGEVLAAAQENWGIYPPRYDDPPLTLRVLVQPGSEVSPVPVHRLQDHLYSVVASSQNYAMADFDALFAYAWVTEATVADSPLFRWFFLDSMTGSTLAQRHAAPMHAACVERNGIGVLLWGPSGMGKSTLAFACARSGWTFVSDDAAILAQNHDECVVTGKPNRARFREDAPLLFPELELYAMPGRPTGKPSVEIPMASFPQIRTSVCAEVKRLVFLERGSERGLERISAESALEQMTQSGEPFGPQTGARHRKAMRRLLRAPAYRLGYRSLDEAMESLENLTA